MAIVRVVQYTEQAGVTLRLAGVIKTSFWLQYMHAIVC